MKRLYIQITALIFTLLSVENLNSQACTTSGTITIGSTGTYATLTAAINNLAANGIGGAVILELQTSYTPSSETYPLSLRPIPCASASNTITIRPASGVTSAFTLTSAATQTVKIDTGKYYRLDGRPGGSGTNNFIVIENTSTSGTALLLQNDAAFNNIRNCVIQGVNTTTTIGTLMFGTTNGTIGNSYNRIEFCNIGNATTNPVHAVYSSGTAATPNIRNIFSKNNVYNFQGGTSYGFYSSANSSRWIVDSNSFYQTTNTVSANQTRIIYFVASDSNYVRNNFIGGNAPYCSGTWLSSTATASNAGRIIGIWMDGATTFPSFVDNNTIQNFSLITTSGGSAGPGIFCGIYTTAGNVNIGTIAGNTIGSTSSTSITGTTSTSITTGSNYGMLGISSTSTGIVNIKNNIIGGMSLTGAAATTVSRMRGIVNTGGTGLKTIENNIIGGNLANSLLVGVSGTTTVANELYGIENAGTGVVIIKNNTISNLIAFSSSSTAAACVGIHVSAGTDTIIENKIKALINSSNDGPRGIRLASTGHFVAYNHIDSLVQMNGTSANGIIAIINNSGTGAVTIAYNFIQNLIIDAGTTSGGFIQAMTVNQAGQYSVFNNTFVLGLGSTITNASVVSGIKLPNASGTINLKNNLIYINANPLSWAACLQNTATTGTSAPTTTLFSADNNTYYINDGATNYIYGQGANLATPDLVFHKCLTCGNSSTYIFDPGFNTSCSLYKAFMTPRDTASEFEQVPFTGGATKPNNLIPNPTGSSFAQNGGKPLGYSRDYFNVSVSATTPDVGAAEFTAGSVADITPPVITYTDLPNLNCPAAVSLSATITDTSKIDTTTGNKPRMYYKKTTDADAYGANTAATNGWKYVEASNSISPFVFNMNFSILNGGAFNPGDTLQYFVVAVDKSSASNFAIDTATLSPTVCLNSVDMSISGVTSTTNTKKFYLNAPASLSITKTPTTMCMGDTVTLTATSGATSYSWTSNKTGATVLGTSNVLKHATPDSPTIYTCSIVQGGCTYTKIDTVRPNKLPKLLKAIDSIQCGSGIPKCKVSDSNSFSTRIINWYSSATATSPLQSGTDSTYLSSISSTTIFYVSINNPTTGCKSPRVAVTATVSVADSISAKINNTKDSFAICFGNSVNLSSANIQMPSTTMTYTTYTWTASSAGSGISSPLANGTGSQTITPSAAGIYVLTATATNGLCTNNKTVKLNVLVAPTAINIVQDSITICKGSFGMLNATGAMIGATSSPKTWSPTTNLFANSMGTVAYSTPIDTVYPKSSATTWYYASYTHSTGCSTKDSAKVIVVDTVTIMIQPISQKKLCIGDTLKLIAGATSTASISKQWRKNGTNITGNTTATKDTLIVITSSLADSGIYDMVYNTASPCSPKSTNSCQVIMRSPIIISTQPIATNVCLGSSIRLIASSSTDSSAFWTQIGGSNTSTLDTFYKASASYADSGLYFMTFKGFSPCPNKYSDTIKLSVMPLAQITNDPATLTNLCIGQSTTLKATYTNGVSFQWLKNGSPISGANLDSLVISASALADSGTYQLVVNSAAGCKSDTSSISAGIIKIKLPPTISTQPASKQTVCQNGSVTMTISATNVNSYQWKRNGVAVSTGTGGTTNTYTINPVSTTNAGIYTVDLTGTSPCSMVTSTNDTLVVTPLATISTQPTAETICSSDTMDFSVTATNAASYQWQFNGSNIGTNTSIYQKLNATLSDSGMYRVIVYSANGCKSDTSISVLGKVIQPISITQQPISNAYGCVGAPFSLTVAGSNYASLLWYKGTTPTSTTTATLSISSFSMTDTGSYYVVFTGNSPCPNLNSTIANVLPTSAANITMEPDSLTNVCLGNKLKLSTTATTAASYQWYKNGTAISGANQDSLVIASATASDAGTYKVIALAYNGCTNDTSRNATVAIQTPVSLTSIANSESKCEGMSINLSATASGSGPFTYTWYRNSTIVGSTNSLAINNITITDSGIYKLMVQGHAACPAVYTNNDTIMVNKAPKIAIKSAQNPICQGSTLQLNIDSASNYSKIYWYKFGVANPLDSTMSLTKSNAQKLGDETSYYAKAMPLAGCTSVSSNNIDLLIKEPASITVNPLSAALSAGDNYTLSVVAIGTGPYTYQWYKDGSLIIGATNTSYIISNFSPMIDSGLYYCLIKSGAPCYDSLNSGIAIIKEYKCPVITQQPIAFDSLCEGSPLELTVQATGVAYFQWYKDNVAIPNAKFNFYTRPKSTIADKGIYTVQAYGYAGNICPQIISNPSKVFIQVPPSIVKQPKAPTLCDVSSHTLEVSTINAAQHLWYQNGQAISGANQLTYTHTNFASDTFYLVATSPICPSVMSNKVVLKKINPSSSVALTPSSVWNLVEQCTDNNGWTYYGKTAHADSLYLAIKKNGNIVTASPDIEVLANSREILPTNIESRGAVLGSRLFNLDFNQTIIYPYEVKFYFSQAEENAVLNRFATIKSQNGNRFSTNRNNEISFIVSTQLPFTNRYWSNLSIPLNIDNTIVSEQELGTENGVRYVIIKKLVATKSGGTMFMDYFLKNSQSIHSTDDSEIMVYPTITRGQVHIEFDKIQTNNLELKVMDLTGKIVFTSSLKKSSKEFEIDLSNLSNGNYILEIGGDITRKIVIAK